MTHHPRTPVFVAAAVFGSGLAWAAAALPAAFELDEPSAQSALVESVAWGRVPLYLAAEPFRAASAEQRVTLVQQTLAWSRAFVATPAFTQAYAAMRAQNEPTAPEVQGSVDDELKAQRLERQKALADMKASIKQMPPEMRAQMEQVARDTEAQYKQLDQDAGMAAMQKQGLEQQRAAEQQAFQEARVRWQKEWPADGRVLVARRLREFLAACTAVDFSAALAPRGEDGKRRFVDPKLEAKSAEWKTCYRAGKAPTEAARAAANAWLAELPKG